MDAPCPARLIIVTPPILKPCEPGLSGAAAAHALRGMGADAAWVDGSIGWWRHTLAPERLEAAYREAERAGLPAGRLLACKRAARAVAEPSPLREPAIYRDRKRYTSAVGHLVNALKLASVPHPGVSLRVGDLEVPEGRALDSTALLRFAQRTGPFDPWITDELLPSVAARGATHLGVSLTFAHQAFAAFRLAALARERLPGLRLLLAGPLVACWAAVGSPLGAPVFGLFAEVLPAGDEAELSALARRLGGHGERPPGPWVVDLDEAPWDHYLVPQPTVPAAIGRGCYWRACAFCPDHLHAAYRPARRDALDLWLHQVAARFPRGAMLHLTDSALAPAHLERVADVIRRDRLPIRWHGFVRVEARFADPAFARHLAEGGAATLQVGVETASPRLLELMDKGAPPERARAMLRALAAAGVPAHVYLLFGLPTETDADRELTLAFVEEEGAAIADLNTAILNLPRGSPLQRDPARYGITSITPFGAETDLSLYDDFRSGDGHPRTEARRWLDRRFFKSAAVRRVLGDLHNPFKANHSCFLS